MSTNLTQKFCKLIDVVLGKFLITTFFISTHMTYLCDWLLKVWVEWYHTSEVSIRKGNEEKELLKLQYLMFGQIYGFFESWIFD